MDKKELVLHNEDGSEERYEILFAFINPNNKLNYVIYTDNTYTPEGEQNLYASIYYPDDPSRLDNVTTDEEWNYIYKLMEELR